jgi:phytoene/squalene synthetase
MTSSTYPSSIELYSHAAEQASGAVIASYSTSFGVATKLLAPSIRRHVRNIYALVRVADEIVDGAASDARAEGGNVDPAFALDQLENEIYKALRARFSTNLVVHAFAQTADETRFSRALIEPFFASMRMDLWPRKHNKESFQKYVYGSAEVVGLMCLHAFIKEPDYSPSDYKQIVTSARALGAAFQKVNFLRDLAADFKKLGRSYFPDVDVNSFDENQKAELLADIREDLATAAIGLKMLPRTSRPAVAAAQMLFTELANRIEKTPAVQMLEARISVPNSVKLLILLKAIIGVVPK